MLGLETKHYSNNTCRQQALLTLRSINYSSASCIQVSLTGCTSVWDQQIHTYSLIYFASLSFLLPSSHVFWAWLKSLIPVRRNRVRSLAFVYLCFPKGQGTFHSKPEHGKLTQKLTFLEWPLIHYSAISLFQTLWPRKNGTPHPLAWFHNQLWDDHADRSPAFLFPHAA